MINAPSPEGYVQNVALTVLCESQESILLGCFVGENILKSGYVYQIPLEGLNPSNTLACQESILKVATNRQKFV